MSDHGPSLYHNLVTPPFPFAFRLPPFVKTYYEFFIFRHFCMEKMVSAAWADIHWLYFCSFRTSFISSGNLCCKLFCQLFFSIPLLVTDIVIRRPSPTFSYWLLLRMQPVTNFPQINAGHIAECDVLRLTVAHIAVLFYLFLNFHLPISLWYSTFTICFYKWTVRLISVI